MMADNPNCNCQKCVEYRARYPKREQQDGDAAIGAALFLICTGWAIGFVLFIATTASNP